jgi:hypothetical protein
VVEVEDLLAEMKILEKGRPPFPDTERILVVRNLDALGRGQRRLVGLATLMQLAAIADLGGRGRVLHLRVGGGCCPSLGHDASPCRMPMAVNPGDGQRLRGTWPRMELASSLARKT